MKHEQHIGFSLSNSTCSHKQSVGIQSQLSNFTRSNQVPAQTTDMYGREIWLCFCYHLLLLRVSTCLCQVCQPLLGYTIGNWKSFSLMVVILLAVFATFWWFLTNILWFFTVYESSSWMAVHTASTCSWVSNSIWRALYASFFVLVFL